MVTSSVVLVVVVGAAVVLVVVVGAAVVLVVVVGATVVLVVEVVPPVQKSVLTQGVPLFHWGMVTSMFCVVFPSQEIDAVTMTFADMLLAPQMTIGSPDLAEPLHSVLACPVAS